MKAVEVRNIKIGEGIPKICVPIVGVTKEDIINEAKTFENIPVDVVEWRVDWFENVFDIENVRCNCHIHQNIFAVNTPIGGSEQCLFKKYQGLPISGPCRS